MRKKIIDTPESTADSDSSDLTPSDQWLDLDANAQVEVSSEAAEAPIEGALMPGRAEGWQAAESGEQTLRLIFDQPVSLRRAYLAFEETRQPRTQEFALRWQPAGETVYRELLRQQYHFSPPQTVREVEDYRLGLTQVQALELIIKPDINGGLAQASLARLRLA